MARPPGVAELVVSPQMARYRDPLAGNEREIFLRIAMSPGTTTTEVAEITKLAPEVVSRIVKKLIGLKWVMERVDGKDRRVKRLGMTDTGEKSLFEHFARILGQEPGSVKVRGIGKMNLD